MVCVIINMISSHQGQETTSTLSTTFVPHLSCPKCCTSLSAQNESVQCATCSSEWLLRKNLLITQSKSDISFFDDKFQVMTHGNAQAGTHYMFYKKQNEFIAASVKAGNKILDIGCGPSLSYHKPAGSFIIGLDSSLPSVSSNTSLDFGIYGSSEAIPLENNSVDFILCLYSIHHMVGNTRIINQNRVQASFVEFERVLKPGGQLLIFEVSPWKLIWLFEYFFWNICRKILGTKLDMFFWSEKELRKMGDLTLKQASFKRTQFKTPPFNIFSPIFNIQKLKIPALLYPFDLNCFQWKKNQ